MKLSEPKQLTFWIAMIVAVIALIAKLVPSLGVPYSFLLLLVGFVVLAAGNLFKGL